MTGLRRWEAAATGDVEATTDRLAAAPFGVLDAPSRDLLIDALDPVARAIAASGTIRYPNPMGLPALV